MTALNARLRRQALILSLLPDLVIAIDVEGTITFCSAQVERVLQHSVDDLIGAKLTDIMVPGSQDKLQTLIQELLSPSSDQQDQGSTTQQQPQEQQAAQQEQGDVTSLQKSAKKAKLKKDNENDASARMAGDISTNAVTDTSFPLSVVQVDPAAGAPASLDENDNSDGSNNSKQPPSSLTNSSLGNSGSDDGTPKMDDRPIKKGVSNNSCSNNNKKLSKEDSQSSDSSNTSSTVSSDVKNLLSANANLERNVRWHNKNFMKDKRAGYKDDVLGAAVTANNASARLSSLQHRRSSDSSEEDSGYRESNDSREETSSSEGENSSESNGTLSGC
jgi:PAS domain S-box-containing protein